MVRVYYGLPRWLSGKESACNEGDMGSIPGSGRFPGEANGNPLQDSCLGKLMDKGAWWWATVHRFEKSQTRLNAQACNIRVHNICNVYNMPGIVLSTLPISTH